MLVTELIEQLSKVQYPDRNAVVIPVMKMVTTIGGSPRVAVTSINCGFDWDANNVFLVPESPVMMVSDYTNEPDVVRKLQDKIGWLEYEKQSFKSQIRTLTKRIKELEDAKQ